MGGNAVAIVGPSNPWLLVEDDSSKVDEIIIGLTLIGTEEVGKKASSPRASKKAGKGKKKDKDGGAKGGKTPMYRSGSMKDDEDEGGGDNGDNAPPISPRGGK